MIPRLFPVARSVLLLVALALALSACVVRPGPPHRHVHWYYPDAEVYFDVRTRVYFYYSDGRWITVRVLPPHLRARLDRHVEIRSRYERPYEHHDRYRRQYPVTPGRQLEAVPDGRRERGGDGLEAVPESRRDDHRERHEERRGKHEERARDRRERSDDERDRENEGRDRRSGSGEKDDREKSRDEERRDRLY